MGKRVRKQKVYRQTHDMAQGLLWSPPLEAKIPPQHPVRAIKAIIAELDLTEVHALYPHQGGYPYPPHLMLGMLIYGILRQVRSSRELQELCQMDLRFVYLMEGLEPDDRTICRFRRRLGSVLPKLMQQVLQLAVKRGGLNASLVALDGTKIEGQVSQWNRQMDREDAACEDEPTERVAEAVGDDETEEPERTNAPSETSSVHCASGRTDTDARWMRGSRGRFLKGYVLEGIQRAGGVRCPHRNDFGGDRLERPYRLSPSTGID